MLGCTAFSNGGSGIKATTGSVRIEGNHVSLNNRGIEANGFIVKNRAAQNTTNYDISGDYGAIITNPGPGFSNTNPWANFAD